MNHAEFSNTLFLPDELRDTPVTISKPAYRVTAQLSQPRVHAYGKQFVLKPGMTLFADIRLAERSLLQWLFEPLHSLRGHL